MVEQVSQLGSYDFFSVSTIMSTCVKVLTMFTQLHVRKQWDVIITNLPHLLNKVICVLVFLLKRYSESLMSESSLSDHNGNMFSCFCNTLKEEIFWMKFYIFTYECVNKYNFNCSYFTGNYCPRSRHHTTVHRYNDQEYSKTVITVLMITVLEMLDSVK